MRPSLRAALAPALALLLGAAPSVRADDKGPPGPKPSQNPPGKDGGAAAGGAGGAPPADNRFFPKEMEDALAAMDDPSKEPEDQFSLGPQVLARLRQRDGALEPLRAKAYEPLLRRALEERREYWTSFCGEILAALDGLRLRAEVTERAGVETDGRRLEALAVLAEEAGGVESIPALVRMVGKGSPASRARAVEALGFVAAARDGKPVDGREAAVGALIAAYTSAGKDTDLKNAAALALGRVGDPRAVAPLVQGLFVDDGKHAFFAALALSWIEDPSVFPTVQSLRAPTGGFAAEAYCKALEACAREAHVETLLSSLANSGRADVREAVALALGRLGAAMPDPGEASPSTTTTQEEERRALRKRIAEALFQRMTQDQDRYVQWACFHGAGRTGGAWLGPAASKLLSSNNPETLARGVHLVGDWKHAESAARIGRNLLGIKDPLMRRRAAIEFWRIGDEGAIADFLQRVKDQGGGEGWARGCDAIGSWRSPKALRWCIDALRASRDGSREQLQIEFALEKMTGHFFGPSAAAWTKWSEKNPGFFSKSQAKVERDRWRDEFDRENKGFRQTEDTERAVQRGLDYLARHQLPDGQWDASRFRSRCDEDAPCSVSTGARVQEDPVSRTGLSALAFFGAGYSPREGKFKHALRRGLDYLMARQKVHGDYLTNDLIGGYNRPICLQAYAEAAVVTGDPRYRLFAQRGVDFLMQIQNEIGGWRYRVEVNTSDSSVVAWMLFAMKAAEKAGCQVREIVYDGCRLLFETYAQRVDKEREELIDIDPDYGFEVGRDTKYEFWTGYQDAAQAPNKATAALGIMSRILLGYRRSHPFCIGSANYILNRQLPDVPAPEDFLRRSLKQEYPLYFLYYGTLSMHQMGGRYFRTWNDRIRVFLPGAQIKEGCPRGSWPARNHDGFFGGIYTAAVGTLTLETYYRYAPILQD